MPRAGVAGWAIVAGACLCFFGGAVGASIGAWSARDPGALLALVNEHTTAWRLANWPWVAGLALATAGVLGVVRSASHGALARLGADLWLVAGILGAAAFAGREITVAAARLHAASGSVPEAYAVVTAWTAAHLAAFMVLAATGTVVVGVGLLRDRHPQRMLAWGTIAAPLVLSPLILLGIPAGVLLGGLVLAAVGLRGEASRDRAGAPRTPQAPQI